MQEGFMELKVNGLWDMIISGKRQLNRLLQC